VPVTVSELVGDDACQSHLYILDAQTPKQSEQEQSSANTLTAKCNAISVTIRSNAWKEQSQQCTVIEDIKPLSDALNWHTDVLLHALTARNLHLYTAL
jgi:hypothetical protein